MGILCRHAIRVVFGVIALSFGAAWAAEPAWPGFRGPDANPIVPNGTLPEKRSKTENVEWAAEIPGRGWRRECLCCPRRAENGLWPPSPDLLATKPRFSPVHASSRQQRTAPGF